MYWSIDREVRWGLGIAVVTLCGLGMIGYGLYLRFVNTSDWVTHSHLVIETIQGARTGLDDAETGMRGFLLTRDLSFLAPYDLVKGRIPGVIDRLRLLTADNGSQHQRMEQLKPQVDREMELLQRAVEAAGARPALPAEQVRLLSEDQLAMSGIRNALREARLQEDQILSERNRAWQRDLMGAMIAGSILAALNFVLLGATYYVFESDFSKRRRVEAALKASEERMRLMIASVKDYAFFMLDPEGRVATWNDGAAILKGYRADEIVGQPFSTFFLEDDRIAGKPELLLEDAAKNGRAEMEGWRVRKDGSQFWTDAITSAIRDEKGSLLGFSEVSRDLTGWKLTEEKIQRDQARLAAILDGSPSIIFVKDAEGRYTLINRKFEESFRTAREQVLGKQDTDLFSRETAHKLGEHDTQAIESDRALVFEEVIPRIDGARTYLSSRVPLANRDHQPDVLCGVLTDITQRKASEKEIQKLNRELQDRVVDHSVELMQVADQLKIEREQRVAAEASEREVLDRLYAVMHTSTVPMWICDLNGLAILGINNAAVALHGSSRDELSKSLMTDIFPAEEIHLLERRNPAADSASPAEQPTALHHRAKNGRVTSLGVLMRPLQWTGADAALLVLISENEGHRAHDVSGSREAAGS